MIFVSAVGSMNADLIRSRFEQRFDKIDRSRISEIHTEFITTPYETHRVREELPVKQGKLVLGFRAGTRDRFDNNPAVSVMADIFGGGTYSYLFANVREKLSLCYYCRAQFNKHKGVIFVQSGVESEKAEEAKTAILAQLDAIRQGNVDEETLNYSKRSFADTLAGYGDSPEMLESWYGVQIFDDTFKTFEERAAEIEAVTLADIIEAANRVTLDTVYLLKSNGEGEGNDENADL